MAGSLIAGIAAAEPGWAQASSPGPPSAGAVSAAAGQVSRRAAELSSARVRLARASAQLASLRTQAEVIIERYDQTMVEMHQAAVAYRAAQARLGRATAAERASRARVGQLAARDYEAAGGFGTMAAMLSDSAGPQAFLNGVGVQQQLAQQGTDVLSQDHVSRIVAGVFRAQAQRELRMEQAAARRAAALKAAIAAAVARQQAAVQATQASTRRLEAALGAARTREYELELARQRALAADQARRSATAGPPVGAAGPVGGQAPGAWASGFPTADGAGAERGDIAANWALSQIGKPYQWGGAGPDTYDCSGLTMDAWARAGVRLQHWTGFQWPSGPHIPIDQLRRGDLLFFATNTSDPNTIHHVGIYIGNGDMVDAPYTGVDVRIDSIYQPGGLIGATRPAG
ncbi:MAG TPA: C40 family peptidase [Streptosporangiaceae bacterium]